MDAAEQILERIEALSTSVSNLTKKVNVLEVSDFQMADKNDDGVIDQSEWIDLMNKINQRNQETIASVQKNSLILIITSTAFLLLSLGLYIVQRAIGS